MPDTVSLSVNSKPVDVSVGTTVAVAVLIAGFDGFRTSVSREPRGPLCGMGICFECRVTVDGVPHARSCQIECANGMRVSTE